MKPDNALNFLDQSVSQIHGTRELHVQLQQAIECLRVFVANADEPKDTELKDTEPKKVKRHQAKRQ